MFKHSDSVPKAMRPIFDEVVAITDAFCTEHLTNSYADLARYMVAALSRKRPSPLSTGRHKTWAAGIVYALGRINFLFDPANKPHLTATDLCEHFGVSQGAAYGKSKEAWDALGLMQMDPHWSLPERMDQNPVAWMVFLDGLIVDIRRYHRETQEVAFEQGLIPFIYSPEGKDDESACQKGLLPNQTLEKGLAGNSGAPVVRLMSFEVTYDELEDEFSKRLKQIPDDGQELYGCVHEDPRRAIARLKKLIDQYPDIPTLYNWLCIAYSNIRDHQAARAVAETIFKRHPRYLFGRLNYAEMLLAEGKLREVFEVIGKTFILTDVELDRGKFHISEVLSFYGLVTRYVLRLGKLKTAISFLSMLQKIEPDHRITRLLEELVDQNTPRPIPSDARRFLSMR
ncbi:MAG: hypothetical protein HQL87_12230 [Magnetococcales bacterium]|nr:hypothetical protein [Magnetococcales bacterium]